MNAKEKMIKYGAGVLSPADLISVVIGEKYTDVCLIDRTDDIEGVPND